MNLFFVIIFIFWMIGFKLEMGLAYYIILTIAVIFKYFTDDDNTKVGG